MRAQYRALGRARNGMNKTEAAHAQDLELRRRAGEIEAWLWEPLRLKLAPDCTYEPDFMVLMKDGAVEFHEVKGGFITDDGLVKLKVAAERFNWFRFVLYQYDRRGVKVKEMPVL